MLGIKKYKNGLNFFTLGPLLKSYLSKKFLFVIKVISLSYGRTFCLLFRGRNNVKVTNVVVEWLKFLLLIREVSGSDLGPHAGCPD
jgi:hypothetical protein